MNEAILNELNTEALTLEECIYLSEQGVHIEINNGRTELSMDIE